MAEPIKLTESKLTLRACILNASITYGTNRRKYIKEFKVENTALSSDEIPQIIIPRNAKVKLADGKTLEAKDLQGYVGVIIHTITETKIETTIDAKTKVETKKEVKVETKNATFCVLSHISDNTSWGEVSIKAGYNLGYDSKLFNQSIGPTDKFLFGVFIGTKPKWKLEDLKGQIATEGMNQVSGDATSIISNALGMVSSGMIKDNQVDYENIDRYIITINRNSPDDINYKTLKKNHVMGAMVEAGYLYNTTHTLVKQFQNPKLGAQMKAINSAKLSHGLYMITRAETIGQVDKELAEFKLVANKFPPILGVWLRLKFTKSVSTNDNLLKHFYNRLVELGFKNKIGLYVTKTELKQITWKKHYKQWYLWWDSHVKEIDEIDQLLTPDFFILPEDKKEVK